MKRMTKAAALVTLASGLALPMAASASPWSTAADAMQTQAIQVKGNGCPPGLAKKHNGCNPPGLAKKQAPRQEVRRYEERRYEERHDDDRVRVERYHVGDRFYPDRGDYVVIRDPDRYGLDPNYRYYRDDNQLFRLDRDTMEIVALMGLAGILSQ
ncbi:S26 family signal peptidase [Pseudooceanicola nanhaiensis]|uniref:S26 family signal peptidase n=1 Tax=Pseudooceanicola nanhaiensis TaxID=375761 RepID=UPI001CD1ACFF|nr:S26 family signal peptidase [Pseudooceanicola nanhaiensis]MCA0920046.1 S26 family signal peptidase [Pseudooceanicola nanhaiensis]